MTNVILIAVLVILFHPSKEATLRLKRSTGKPSINDGVSQKGVYTLLDQIVSLVSPGIIKDGVDRGFQLRSVANVSSNVTHITNQNTSADDDVDEKDLYNLLSKIITLILKAINQVSSNKNASSENKFNEMEIPVVTGSTITGSTITGSTITGSTITGSTITKLETTSQPHVSDNAISSVSSSSTLPTTGSTGTLPTTGSTGTLPTTGSTGTLPTTGSTGTLPTTGSTGVESSTQNVTSTGAPPVVKKLREARVKNFLRENNIGQNENIKNGLIGKNNLIESDFRNIFPRSDSGSFTLDKTLEGKNSEADTKSLLMNDDSNFVDLLANKKEWRDSHIQRLSDNVNWDSNNLKDISNIFSDISSVPKKTRDAVLVQVPKFSDSLNWNLADADSSSVVEKDVGESNLGKQSTSDESNQLSLKNNENVDRKNRNEDDNHEERNWSSLKSVGKHASRNKPHKKIPDSDGKNVNSSKLCKNNDVEDADSQMFVCSFTIEINKGVQHSGKPGQHLDPDKKKGNKLSNTFREPGLRKESKVEQQQFPIKEDEKMHRVHEDSNSFSYVREEQTTKLSTRGTTEVRHNEDLKKDYEEKNEGNKRWQSNLSNTRFDKDKYERNNKNENSNFEGEKQKTLETNGEEILSQRENLRNIHTRKKIANKDNSKDRPQNSVKHHRLNNMATPDGQDTVRNNIEVRPSHSRPALENGDPSGNRIDNHAEEKDKMEAGLEDVVSGGNEVNDGNMNAISEKEEDVAPVQTAETKEESEQNRHSAESNGNRKDEDAEENVPKEREPESNNDNRETDGGSDAEVNENREEEQGEEAEEHGGNQDEVEPQNDEDERTKRSLREDNEVESLREDDYDLYIKLQI